jgi:hypothetical protein
VATGPLRPFEHSPTGAFEAVAQEDLLWQTELEGKFVEKPGHSCTRDRHVDDLARTEPAMIIDHVQHPEPPVIGELITHEVKGPALHRPVRRLNGDPILSRQLATLLRANLETLLDVKPVRPLVVHDQHLAPQHGVQPRRGIAAVLRGELLYTRDCCTDRASPTIRQLRRSLRPSSVIRKPTALRFAMSLPMFLHKFLHHRHVEHLFGDDALELGVLRLERFQPLRVGNLHPAKLGTPSVERRAADAVPAAQSSD